MIDTFLVEKTVVTAKGDGPAVEVSIYGSGDGTAWSPKPIVGFPQKFYCEQTPLLLDLTKLPDVKFVRTHWEVARWGRGTETPMFEVSLRMKEVPAEILREATAEAKAMV
jgi:hypothetical protein